MNKNEPTAPLTLTAPGDEIDTVKVRDFHGYHQYLEHYDVGARINKRWVFYISGFCFDDKHAHVLRTDGTKEAVPIDAKGRILIRGKRYGRTYWNH